MIPINHILKIRHQNFKINNLIPKKKRLFITKKICPKSNDDSSSTDENIIETLPVSSICFTTKKTIFIKKKSKCFTSVNNKYSFFTKLYLNKENLIKNDKKTDVNEDINVNKSPSKKYPCKLYRKAIISPNKINLFRSNKKLKKIKKNRYSSAGLGSGSAREGSKDENLRKRIKKKEKISLISRDKADDHSSQKSDSKGQTNRLQKNKDYVNEFSDEIEGNHIDISIQFSNEPINMNKYNKNNKNEYYNTRKHNVRSIKTNNDNNKCQSAAKKNKNKNVNDSLYKDLNEINSRLNDKTNLFINHHHNGDYEKHYGDEMTCPKCREMRKRCRKMEKEKGLFHAFNFKNSKTISKKALNKLKMIQFHKTQNNNINNINSNSNMKNKIDLLSDDERKKELQSIYNNYNKYKNSEFKKKYLQFNGMNKLHKFNRYGSAENFMNHRVSRNENVKTNNNKKNEEKSDDIYNNSEYPVLRNYFHDDNNYFDSNNFFI